MYILSKKQKSLAVRFLLTRGVGEIQSEQMKKGRN